MYINWTFETRAARIAFWLIHHRMKSRGYPAKHERLVTAKELARLGL